MPTTILPLAEDEIQSEAASLPLQIRVTDAGGMLIQLHSLLRQTVPILEKPENYPTAYRREMAERIKTALTSIPDTADYDDAEPGSWLNEEEPW